jgi:hypothetical protein
MALPHADPEKRKLPDHSWTYKGEDRETGSLCRHFSSSIETVKD